MIPSRTREDSGNIESNEQRQPEEILPANSVYRLSQEVDPEAQELHRFQKTLSLVGGAGIVAGSLWLFQQGWARKAQWLSIFLIIAGLVLFTSGVRSFAGNKMLSWPGAMISKLAGWLKIAPWQVVCLGFSPVFSFVAWLAAGSEARMHDAATAVVAWLAGITLAILGGWRFSREEPGAPESWRPAITAILLVLLAGGIRIVNLTQIPIVLSGDEGSVGLNAVEFVRGETNNIFRTGWFSFPSLYSFLQSIPIALFGQTAASLRLSSVIAGSLTVGGVYLVGRAMFGAWPAFFSALFLVSFHIHNHFSRIGLNNIWDGLWFIAVLGSLWFGWQHKRRWAFLLAGLCLGLAQFFYVSARLLFLLAPIWALAAGLFDRDRLRRNLPELSLMALVTLVTILPLAIFYAGHPDEYMAPINRASVLGDWLAREVEITGQPSWRILSHQLALSVMGYTYIPIRYWYDPGVPLLRPVSASLFIVGILLLLLKGRDSQTSLVLLWVVLFTLVGALSESTPAAQRYVAVTPAVGLLVGYGLAEIATQLSMLWERSKRLITGIAMASILIIAADELRFYYLDYTPRSDFGGVNTLVAQRLADTLKGRTGDTQVLFFSSPRMVYTSIPSLPYLAPHIHAVDVNHPWGAPENPQPVKDNLLFVFLPERAGELEAVMADYPGGKLYEETDEEGSNLYLYYEYQRRPTPSSPGSREDGSDYLTGYGLETCGGIL